MLALRTFGAVYVSEPDGTPMGGPAAQKRLLALLTVLACAGESGMSRDRVVGLLWPESEPERARHALTQTLYHARRVFGCDDLFILGGGDIRLNRARLSSDIDQFETRSRSGDHDGAMAAYGGAFLDGFFLSGVAEFEQWTSAQRLRFSEMAAHSCDALATAAEHDEEWRAAVEWRKNLLSLDPLSAVATAKLMSAMAAAGDRAGALNQARIYATLLREQLDLEPDALVTQLADELRTTTTDSAWESRPASIVPGVRPVALARPPFDSRFSRHRWRSLRVPALVSGLAVAVLAAFSAGQRGVATSAAAVAPTGAQPVFVAPFRVTGADPSLAYLKEGMVELLSTRLADDSLVHAVDPGAALAAWRRSRLAGTADVSRPAAIAVARSVGASRVVVGSVVGNQSQLVVSASLVATPSGDLRAEASVEGPADSITVLVDRLAVQLLAANAGEADRFVAHAPPPLSALREFLSGQAAYRAGDYPAAIAEYERALRDDPTFSLAALQLALAADWQKDTEHRDRALALAWRYRDHLSERDKAHLIAFAGPRFPAPSTPAEYVAAWQHAVTLAPDRADAWYELGARYFHSGNQAGVTDASGRAVAALRRALALEPGHTRAQAMLARVTLDTARRAP